MSCKGVCVLEGIDPSVLIGSVAAVIVLLALIGFAVMAHINRQQTTHDRQQIVKLRRKRFADYAAAKQEYQRLRKKIEKGPIRIATVRGLGYCLEKI